MLSSIILVKYEKYPIFKKIQYYVEIKNFFALIRNILTKMLAPFEVGQPWYKLQFIYII